MDQSFNFKIENNSFKSGFVSIIGLPNSGKSTFINAICNYPLSIISNKPQTTRDEIKGIINGENYQIILIDTPGFLKPKNLLEKKMVKTINTAIYDDSDLICLLIEPNINRLLEKKEYFEKLKQKNNILLLINKTDLYNEEKVKEAEKLLKEILLPIETINISALNKTNIKKVKEKIITLLPISPPYYERDILSDKWERFFASEIIRETIFNLYKQEVPYSCAVEIDLFKETEKENNIYAIIYISRKAHKPIIIGKDGRSLKRLREISQEKISKLLNKKTILSLHIKVNENWQENPLFLKKLYGE